MTRKEWEADVRRRIVATGLEPIKAEYDTAGNCRTCGEAGRCPGYHTQGEGIDDTGGRWNLPR